MGHEISQFDITDRQLLAGSSHACMRSDIGEAKITRTIFGKAKIRVIREKDKIIRAWLLAALAVVAIAAAAWQGWIALQQSRLLATTPPLSERISVSPPVFQPENISSAAARASGKSKHESLIQTEIDSLVASPNVLPQRPPAMNAANPKTATTVTAQPLMASNPLPVPTNNNSPKNQPNMQLRHSLPAPVQPATPAVATPPATQPAANKPAPAVASPGEPLTKKDTATILSAGNDQTPDQANVEPVNARGTALIIVPPQDNPKP
jgi:hypothetical protein